MRAFHQGFAQELLSQSSTMAKVAVSEEWLENKILRSTNKDRLVEFGKKMNEAPRPRPRARQLADVMAHDQLAAIKNPATAEAAAKTTRALEAAKGIFTRLALRGH